MPHRHLNINRTWPIRVYVFLLCVFSLCPYCHLTLSLYFSPPCYCVVLPTAGGRGGAGEDRFQPQQYLFQWRRRRRRRWRRRRRRGRRRSDGGDECHTGKEVGGVTIKTHKTITCIYFLVMLQPVLMCFIMSTCFCIHYITWTTKSECYFQQNVIGYFFSGEKLQTLGRRYLQSHKTM